MGDASRERYPVGSRVHGKVTSVTDFGVFVEIEEGIEGLIHVSQLSTERVDKPQSLYKPGDEVEAEVTSIDPQGAPIGSVDQGAASLARSAPKSRPTFVANARTRASRSRTS